MFAHLEPITFVLRIFENDEAECYKDSYPLSLTIVKVSQDTVKIMGADKKITFSMWRAISKAVHEAGFKFFTFERCKCNGQHRVSLVKARGH